MGVLAKIREYSASHKKVQKLDPKEGREKTPSVALPEYIDTEDFGKKSEVEAEREIVIPYFDSVRQWRPGPISDSMPMD